jgi:hypothetical protein
MCQRTPTHSNARIQRTHCRGGRELLSFAYNAVRKQDLRRRCPLQQILLQVHT